MLLLDNDDFEDVPRYKTESVPRYICRHIFTDGHRCGSYCLRGEEFCYYHHNSRKPVAKPAVEKSLDRKRRLTEFDIPNPEDRSAVLAAIGDVLRRIAANDIDPRRAGLLLYGLQSAAITLPREPRRSADDKSPEPQLVEEIVQHPTYGAIAPQTEFEEPRKEKGLARRLLEEMQLLEANNIIEYEYKPLQEEFAALQLKLAETEALLARAEENAAIAYDNFKNAEQITIASVNRSLELQDALEEARKLPEIQAVAAISQHRARVPHSSQSHRDGWVCHQPRRSLTSTEPPAAKSKRSRHPERTQRVERSVVVSASHTHPLVAWHVEPRTNYPDD